MEVLPVPDFKIQSSIHDYEVKFIGDEKKGGIVFNYTSKDQLMTLLNKFNL